MALLPSPTAALTAPSSSPAGPTAVALDPSSFPCLHNDSGPQSSSPDSPVFSTSLSPHPVSSPGVELPSISHLASDPVSSFSSVSDTVKIHGLSPSPPLKFFPPLSVDGGVARISPPPEVIQQSLLSWKSTLVGCFSGMGINFHAVANIVRRIWKRFGLCHVAEVANGLFLFRFSSDEHSNAVLARAPWTLRGKLLFLKRWLPGMALVKEHMKSFPVWIRLRNVPAEYWTPLGLSWISSAVGKPLHLDPFTAKMERLQAARVCVEISPDSVLPSKIILECSANEGVVATTVEVELPGSWARGSRSTCLDHHKSDASFHGNGLKSGADSDSLDLKGVLPNLAHLKPETSSASVASVEDCSDVPNPPTCPPGPVADLSTGVDPQSAPCMLQKSAAPILGPGLNPQMVDAVNGLGGKGVADILGPKVGFAADVGDVVVPNAVLESVFSEGLEVLAQADRVEGINAGSSLLTSSGVDGDEISDELGLNCSLSKAPIEDPSVEACISSGTSLAATEGSVLDVFGSINSFAILQDPAGSDVQGLKCGPPVESKDEMLVDQALDQTLFLKRVRFAPEVLSAEALSSAPRRRMLAPCSDICHPVKFRRSNLRILASEDVPVDVGPNPGADIECHELSIPPSDGVSPEMEPVSVIDPDITPSPISRILKKYLGSPDRAKKKNSKSRGLQR